MFRRRRGRVRERLAAEFEELQLQIESAPPAKRPDALRALCDASRVRGTKALPRESPRAMQREFAALCSRTADPAHAESASTRPATRTFPSPYHETSQLDENCRSSSSTQLLFDGLVSADRDSAFLGPRNPTWNDDDDDDDGSCSDAAGGHDESSCAAADAS